MAGPQLFGAPVCARPILYDEHTQRPTHKRPERVQTQASTAVPLEKFFLLNCVRKSIALNFYTHSQARNQHTGRRARPLLRPPSSVCGFGRPPSRPPRAQVRSGAHWNADRMINNKPANGGRLQQARLVANCLQSAARERRSPQPQPRAAKTSWPIVVHWRPSGSGPVAPTARLWRVSTQSPVVAPPASHDRGRRALSRRLLPELEGGLDERSGWAARVALDCNSSNKRENFA